MVENHGGLQNDPSAAYQGAVSQCVASSSCEGPENSQWYCGGGLQSPHDVNPPPACRTKGGEEIDLPGILDSKTSKGKSTTSSTQQTIDGCCER